MHMVTTEQESDDIAVDDTEVLEDAVVLHQEVVDNTINDVLREDIGDLTVENNDLNLEVERMKKEASCYQED